MDKAVIETIVRKTVEDTIIKQKEFIIAGNWKMNMDTRSAGNFADKLCELSLSERNKVVIIPPYPYLHIMADSFRYRQIFYGCQNISTEEAGAFTGEVSAAMAADVGCKYVIVGHSERRELYGETDDIVAKKVKKALEHGLVPIVCIGEKLEARKDGTYKTLLPYQLKTALAGCDSSLEQIVVAYEPVWAIGTGLNATPEEVEETHGLIRRELTLMFGESGAQVPILYGGSVKAGNVVATGLCDDVGGFLIGGASLDIAEFTALIDNLGGLN